MSPNTVRNAASSSINVCLPYLSEYPERKDPTGIPNSMMEINRDCWKTERDHYCVSMGKSRPKAMVSQP